MPISEIALRTAPGFADAPPEVHQQLIALYAEGLQVFEHACLVRTEYLGRASMDWSSTRRGRRPLAEGAVERVFDGESL